MKFYEKLIEKRPAFPEPLPRFTKRLQRLPLMTLVYQDSADWLLFDQFSEAGFMHPEHYHDRAELFYPKTGVRPAYRSAAPGALDPGTYLSQLCLRVGDPAAVTLLPG